MNDDIRSLQNLWQSVEPDLKTAEDMISQLNQIEVNNRKSRQYILYSFPTAALILIGIAIWVNSFNVMVGAICILTAMAMILGMLYKNKFEEVRPEEAVTTRAFFQDRIQKLKGQMKVTSVYMWVYFVLLTAGINYAYLDVLQSLDVTFRMVIHSGVTIIMFLISYFGIKHRMKQYQEEYLPLIHLMENYQNEE